jgi:hypothetical protein
MKTLNIKINFDFIEDEAQRKELVSSKVLLNYFYMALRQKY